MSRRRRFGASALLAALTLSACGSTVAVHSTLTTAGSAGSGLNDQQPGAALSGSAPSTAGLTPVGTSAGSAGMPSGGSAIGPAAAPAGVGPAVTGASKPIEIGIVLTATSNADSFGVSLGNTLSEQSIDQALVDALNAQGGLHGRKIIPIFAKTDTGSSNWESDFSAACATFTQDNHVEAVLGYVFNYFASFESCLAKKGIPHLNTGFNIPDTQELRPFPLHEALDVPTIDRRTLIKLEMGAADGVLTSKSRIGVLRDTCPGTGRSYDHVFLPTAKRLGLNVVSDIQVNCANGEADSGGAVQAVQSAVLQFAGNHVDEVFFHAASEGPALLLFALSAESQTYRPGYVVTSLANLEALKGYLPAAQRANVNGYGWMPTQDVPPSAYPKPNALQSRCLSLLHSKGAVPASGPDFYYAYNICEAFFVYERALGVTGGNSSGAAILSAIKGMGTSFASLTNEGGSAFSPSFPDAPRSARHLHWADACTCFQYSGPTRSIPFS